MTTSTSPHSENALRKISSMVNPYKTPATPAPEAAPRLSLLRPARPEIATALWFVCVSAVHLGIIAVPAYLFGESSLDMYPGNCSPC